MHYVADKWIMENDGTDGFLIILLFFVADFITASYPPTVSRTFDPTMSKFFFV